MEESDPTFDAFPAVGVGVLGLSDGGDTKLCFVPLKGRLSSTGLVTSPIRRLSLSCVSVRR